jgi:hypothetical protein
MITAMPLRLPNNAVVHLSVPAAIRSIQPLANTPTDFGEIASTLEGITNSIVAVWEKVKPSKATVDFGLKLEGGSGKIVSLLTEAKAAAHLTIKIEWSQAVVNTNS